MSNIHQLLRALESRPGVDQQIAVLHELNTALTMASGHPSQNRVGGVIQALVPLLSWSNNEVVLLAIRALITCIDITPRTATSLVESGAVTPMCRRLLKIQDMDVAEACLKCLHLLSKDNPRAVLEAGGAKACLAFFDFFPLELQQNALSTVARLVAPGVCGRREDIRRAREILPFLRECLQKQQAGGAVAGGLSVGFHGGGIGVAGSGSGGDVRRSSTASGGGTLRGKDSASDASQMASLCLERMVVSFSTPIESTTERRSVSRKLRRSRSNFSFRAPPRPCERQRPPSLRVANENPAPGTSETPSDPLGAPAVTEAAATADDREPVAKGSKQKLATEREEGQNDREEEALTPEDVGDTPSRSLSSPSSPSSSGDGGGSGNGPKGESRPPAENKGEDVPMDEGGSAADGEGETTAGAAAAASSSYSVLMKGKGKARASNVGASSSAPPSLPAASDGGARNEEWIAAISSADGGVALGDPLVDDGSMVDDAREMAIESLVEMSQKGNRAACDEKDVPPAVDAASAMTMATVGDGLLDVVGFLGMEVDGDEGGDKGDEEKEAVKTNVGDGRSERTCAGAEDFYYDLDVRAAGTQSSCKAPMAAPHGGKKKEQGRLAGGLRAWQVAFVLEIAEGGVLSAWSKTLEDSVKALEGANGDLAPGWRLQSRLLSTIARVVSAAPVAVQALFDVGMPRLLRRILADYVRCDLVTMGAPSGIGSANSEARWKPSTLADGLIGEERLLAALGLATAMLPPPSGKAKDSKASSSRRGKGTTRSRGSATAATTLSSCVRAVEGEPKSMDVDESPDECQDAGRLALEGLGEDSVTGEKMNDSDGGDCTDDDEGLPPDLEQAAVAAAVAAAGKRRREKRGGSSIGRGHFGARDAYEAGGDGGVEETKVAAQGMGERSPAAATATADGTGGPSEDANRGGGGPDGDAWNLAIDPRTTAKTNSSVSSPSLLPAIGGSEVGEEHRQHMTGVEGPTANAAAPRYDAREENNGVGVSANGDPAETAQAQARARRVAEVALKAAAADAAAAASAARAAREAAAAAAAGASGAEWACSACTFINHGSGFGRVCEVCGTPNASAVAAVTAGEAGVFFGGAALEARLQARFRGGRGVGSSGGGMSIWESDAMGGDDDGDDDGSGIPGFPPHWHRGVGAGRGGGNPETVDSRNQAEATVEEDHEDEDDDKNSDKFAPDDKVFVRLRHVYGQDEGLFHEFSRELLAPLLRLVPSGLSSPEAVRLVAAALVSLRQNSVECLLRKEFAEELAAALYRLLSKREHALRTGALAVAKAVLQSRSPEELGEASFSRGKSAGTAGGQEMKSFAPPSASATDRAVYYREVFARHGVLKLMEGSHGEHPSPAFDAEVLRAPSTSSSSSGSPQPLHPTLVNLCGIAARLDPSSPPDPRRLDCVDQNNGDRHGGGRLPRTAKDEEVVVSPAGEQSTSKGKGKAVCPQGGERKETGGSSSCVSSGLSLRGVPGDGPGLKKFAAWDALAKENGFKGGKDGDGSDISLAFSDLTRTLKGHLGGVTTFEAEESGVLRALLRALLNGARGNGSSLGALAAGEESAESMPEEYTAPCRKQTHVAPSEGVHWKGDGGENPPSSFDNGLAPMEAEPVGAVESPEGYGVASMVTPSGSSETPGATFIKREFVDPDEAQLIPVAALQPSPSSPRREGDSTIVAATDGDVRSGSEASSSEVLDWRGAAVGTRLTGSDFYLEVGKALLTPDEDGRLPMESLISTTQGCLQALTDDVVVVHHGGETEAAHYRSLVRPFTVLLSPGPCPPRASPAVPDDDASSHSSEPRPGSAAGVKDEILLPLSGSAAGDDGGDAEEVPKCTVPANAAAAATAASTGGRIGGSSMDSDSGVSTSGVGRDPNACAAVTETRMRGGTKEEGDSAPQQQPSSSLGVSTSTFSVRAGETRKGGRREAAIAERMEAQAGLLKSLSLGLHPVLLVEPLTTVREVIKWYTVQLGKAFKLHRRRQRQERQRAAQEEAQSRVIAAAAAAASALAAAASATEAATPSADSLDAHGGSCSSSATTVGEGTDRPEKKPRSSSPNIATPLLTTSEGSPIPDESPVTTRGKAATAANTGSGWNTPKRMLPDRAAKRNSGLAHSSGSKTFRGARKTRVSRRNSTSSLSSSVSGHAGGDSDMMAAQEAKGESIDIELAVSRATDAAAAAPPAGADGDGGGAAASTAALSSVGQRAAKRRRASSTRAEAEAASGEEGEGGGEGGSSTPRSRRGSASGRSSSTSRANENTATTVETEEDEGSNTRLRKRRKVEGGGSSGDVVMAAGSIAAPSPASGSSQGSVPGLGKKKGSTVGGGGVESGEGDCSAGGKSKPEPTRLRPGHEVFCCFRPSQGEDRSGMWYRGTVGVHHRDGTLDVRFDDGDLRINIPRSHVTITLPSVVKVRQEKRPWCNLWSPEQQQAFPAATSTVSPGSGAGGPSAAATATETATAAMETSLEVEEEPTHPVDGSTGGRGVDGDHAQERPGTVDTLSQSFARQAAEESREEMHRAVAASRSPGHRRRSRSRSRSRSNSNSTPPSPSTFTIPEPALPPPSVFHGVQTASAAAEAASASSSGTRSTKEDEAPSTGPPPVSSSRSGAGGPSSGNMDAAAAFERELERELAMLGHARSMQDARNVVGGFGVGLELGGDLDEFGGQGGGTSALVTGAWPAELQEAAAAAGLALPPFPGGRGRGGVLPPSGHGLSGVGGRASGTTLRMNIPGMVNGASPAGPGVRIQLLSTLRDTPPRPAPGPSSAPGSSSSAAQGGETAAPTPSAAAQATSTSTATEGRPVIRQSSAASSAGVGGSSSSEATAAAAPRRRSSKRKRSTSGNANAGGSARCPQLQWTLRYHWDAASAGNGDEQRVTDVDVTRGEISEGATIFEAIQLLMFKHSQETQGNVPRTRNWDLFKHRSMRVPLEQWGKSITLEFSPRRPESSPISQVEGVSEAGVGARQSVATQQEESASAATTAPSSISPLPTAETPTTMETSIPGRNTRGSSKGDRRKRKHERKSRARPSKVLEGANASPSEGVQMYELPSVLTPEATPLDARLASLKALLEGGGIVAGLRFGEYMCLLAALQAFCEEWGPLRKRLALKGQVDADVPDPHPSVLRDLAKRCIVAGLQRKVSRQACNPLALCSGSLPSWCVRLPAEFPTLFSLETRLALYKKTSFGMARAVALIQEKAKHVEDQPQGSGSSESPNEMMVEVAGVAGRDGDLLGHGGPDAASTPLPEQLRQLGRMNRLTVLLSRDSILDKATFLFGHLLNGQQQPPHQRSIQPPASSGPEAGSSVNRHHSGRTSAPGRLGGGGGAVGGAGTRVRGFGGGGSGSSTTRLGNGDFDVYNDDDDKNYDGEEKAMTHERNDEGGDGGGGAAEMELNENVLSDAEERDPGHGHRHGLPQQAEQPQPPLPSEAGDGSSAVTNEAENKDGNTGHGGEASRGRWALKDRKVATVEASVPPQHVGRQAKNSEDMESMLLVEFAGETGHGTGPTLEFYSLVCRELVRKGLGMWTGDGVSDSPPPRAANSSAVRNRHEEKSKVSPTPEGLDGSEAGESGGKGSASREVEGGDGPGAFSQQDDMAVEEENPFLQVPPEGLFPAPLDVRNRGVCASVEARFRLLGRLMGKALKDGRMLDLPLALPLCSLIVGLHRHSGTASPAAGSPGEGEDGGRGRFTTMEGGGLRGNAKHLTLADVGLMDAALGRSLETVANLAEEVQHAKAFEEMNHDGRLSSGQGGPETLLSPPPRSVSDLEEWTEVLCLTWSLPGCPWYELKPGGANEDVAASDLAEWVHEVTRVFLVDSIVNQVEALVKGVSEVMDPSKLSLLTAPELQRLVGGAVGGAGEDSEWGCRRIMKSLVCRHGYNIDSPQVKWLAQVMASLDHAGRRKFLRFVTGTPRLPIGGFAALRPRLTVVKKEVGSTLGGTPDTHLPSCSTCQVYLKLPAYTSKQALEAKLLHAITEGQDHFALD